MRNLMSNPLVQVLMFVMLIVGALTMLSKSSVGRFILLVIVVLAVLCAVLTWIVKNKPALAASLYATKFGKAVLDPLYALLKIQPPLPAPKPAPGGGNPGAAEETDHTLRFEDPAYDFDAERELLAETVLGQDRVIDDVIDRLDALWDLRVNKQTEVRRHPPLGVILLVGGEGRGKAFLAKKLAAAVFSGGGIFKKDMAECRDAGTASQVLFGDAQGEGGMLAAVRKQPYHAVILENVDATPADALLKLAKALQASAVKDGSGATVSFENCLFVFTTTAGDDALRPVRERHQRSAPWLREAREVLAAATALPAPLLDLINVVGYFRQPTSRASAAIVAKMIERECKSQGGSLGYVAPEFLVEQVKKVTPERGFGGRALLIREEILDDLRAARRRNRPLELGGARPPHLARANPKSKGDVRRMRPEDKILKGLTDLDELDRLFGEEDDGAGLPKFEPAELKDRLKSMVIGQDHVVDSMVDDIVLQSAQNAGMRDKPIACVIFLGRSGVGKTELAKALTECIYKDRKNMIIIDGNNYKDKHQLNGLVGNDSVYSGAKPGTLTSAVSKTPKCVVVFDEMDKAHPELQDIFLTLANDGRVRDAYTGKDVDFTKAIVIVTTNAQWEALERLPEQYPTDPRQVDATAKKHLVETKAIPRYEVVNRFKRVHIFRNLNPRQKAAVAGIKARGLAKKYGLDLVTLAPALLVQSVKEAEKNPEGGMRVIENAVDDLVGPALLVAKQAGLKRVDVVIGDDGYARADAAADAPPAAPTPADNGNGAARASTGRVSAVARPAPGSDA